MKDATTGREARAAAAAKDYIAQCVCFNLRKTSRLITALYNERLAEAGILVTQLPLLAVLNGAGPLPLTRLAEGVDMDRTTLARNLLPLRKHGMISESTGSDRRMRLLAITEKGRDAVARAFPLWRRAQSEMKQRLGTDDFDGLLFHLSRAQSSGTSAQ